MKAMLILDMRVKNSCSNTMKVKSAVKILRGVKSDQLLIEFHRFGSHTCTNNQNSRYTLTQF
jgi:hypothetical protein